MGDMLLSEEHYGKSYLQKVEPFKYIAYFIENGEVAIYTITANLHAALCFP